MAAEKIEEDEEGEEEDKNENLFEHEDLSNPHNQKESLCVKSLLQWHHSKVLGLAWDPRENFLVSLSRSGKLVFSGEPEQKDQFDDYTKMGGLLLFKEIELCKQVVSAQIDTHEQLILVGLEEGPLVVLCYSNDFHVFEIGSFDLVPGSCILKMELTAERKLLVCQFGNRRLVVIRNSWKNVFQELKQFRTFPESEELFLKMNAHVKKIRSNHQLEFLGVLQTETPILDFSSHPDEVTRMDVAVLLEDGNVLLVRKPLGAWQFQPEVLTWDWELARIKRDSLRIKWMGQSKLLASDRHGVTTFYGLSTTSKDAILKEPIQDGRVHDEFEVAELGIGAWEIQNGVLVVGTGEGSLKLRRVFEEEQWRERDQCVCLELELDCWGISGGEVSMFELVPETGSVYVTGQHGQMVVLQLGNSFWEEGRLSEDLAMKEAELGEHMFEKKLQKKNTSIRQIPILKQWAEWQMKGRRPQDSVQDSDLAKTFEIVPVCLEMPGEYSKLVRMREREEVKSKRLIIEKDLLKELENIREEHRELLKENWKKGGGEYVNEREMAVDVDLREQIEEEGRKEVEELKTGHRRKLEELRQMRERLKKECWDGVETQRQSVTGIQAKVVVFNFTARRENAEDTRKVEMGKWFARMSHLEGRFWEKESRKGETNQGEKKQAEFPGESQRKTTKDVLEQVENVVNGIEGREPAVQMDFEKRRKEMLDYLEEERSKEQSKLSKQSKGLGTKKRGYEIQRRRRVKRKNVDTETPRNRIREREAAKDKSRENVGKLAGTENGEEKRGEKQAQLMEIWVDEAEHKRETGPWFWLDSGVEMGGELGKKRGIWFGRWMVRELQREFNRKFGEMVRERKRRVDQIREKDLKIKEICGELKLVPPENEILHNFLER